MRTIKTVTHKSIITDKVTCDKCGEEVKIESSYDTFKCEFVYQIGSCYPEGTFIESRKEMQLCQGCAENFMDFLTEHGYRINDTTDLDDQ